MTGVDAAIARDLLSSSAVDVCSLAIGSPPDAGEQDTRMFARLIWLSEPGAPILYVDEYQSEHAMRVDPDALAVEIANWIVDAETPVVELDCNCGCCEHEINEEIDMRTFDATVVTDA